MRTERDEEKNRRNFAKHEVSFEVAQRVFDDPLVLTRPERIVEGGLSCVDSPRKLKLQHGRRTVRIECSRNGALE